MPDKLLLQMKNIHVSYNGVKALNGVDFDVYEGEIHALVGEHRAGKSSLVKLLSGAVRKKEGEIIYKGKKLDYLTPRSATKYGIGMVYQNLNVIPAINTIENMFIGQTMHTFFGVLKHQKMLTETQSIFNKLNLNINLKLPLHKLSLGQQHMVEFAKIMIMEPELIILDEISNKLTPHEMKSIYPIIFDYKKSNKSIIYITHNMDEILKLADRVTILKNGYRRGTEYVKDLNKFMLFQLTYSFALDQKELEQNEKKFFLIKRYIENILQHLPIGIIIIDIENKIRLFNYTAVEILDVKQDEVINTLIETLFKKFDLDIKNEMKEIIEQRKEHTWDEVSMGKKLLKIDMVPFKDENFVFLGTTIIVQDISLDRSFRDYFIQSEKMTSVAEVAVGVAHEINNPLYIIKNYIDLLKEQRIGSVGETRLTKIEKELNRIVAIVSSLLSFSRIKEFPPNKVNLKNILNEVLLLLEFNFAKKNIKIKKVFPKTSIEINGDENKLKQLFINLINNSIEAVLEDGIIKVELSPISNSDWIQIRISDNGYGIPDDIKDNIFNPFFSTKINKKNTGLGLSICQHIIKEHNGEIYFTSIPGKKTSFITRFPIDSVNMSV